MNIRKHIICVCFCSILLLPGCIKDLHYVKSNIFNPEKIAQIKETISTKEEILKLFGQPESNLKLDDVETFYYKNGNLKALWIEFNSKGYVTRYIFSKE